jgi:hypothetical protein
VHNHQQALLERGPQRRQQRLLLLLLRRLCV